VLNEAELEVVRQSGFKTSELTTLFEIAAGPKGLEAAVRKLQDQAAASCGRVQNSNFK
jgi:glutamate synthase (ferredoxin)